MTAGYMPRYLAPIADAPGVAPDELVAAGSFTGHGVSAFPLPLFDQASARNCSITRYYADTSVTLNGPAQPPPGGFRRIPRP